ncbi:MAG: hypothetical protein ACLSA6_06395 [Holdemania massiliensis]
MKPNEKKFNRNHDGRTVSLGFCVLYFGLFARISETSSAPQDALSHGHTKCGTRGAGHADNDPVSTSTLSWFRPGYLPGKPVRELTAFLEQDGFTPVVYPRDQYQIVAWE